MSKEDDVKLHFNKAKQFAERLRLMESKQPIVKNDKSSRQQSQQSQQEKNILNNQIKELTESYDRKLQQEQMQVAFITDKLQGKEKLLTKTKEMLAAVEIEHQKCATDKKTIASLEEYVQKETIRILELTMEKEVMQSDIAKVKK